PNPITVFSCDFLLIFASSCFHNDFPFFVGLSTSKTNNDFIYTLTYCLSIPKMVHCQARHHTRCSDYFAEVDGLYFAVRIAHLSKKF
ncbi:MAG: hypothetical protein KBG63_06880, partial [Acetobacterium sp.]|nr:hypothetical protein [Acetobacterium sp.]